MSDFLKAQSHLYLLPDPPALTTYNTLLHSLLRTVNGLLVGPGSRRDIFWVKEK